MEWKQILKEDLKRHEGLRLKPYIDTVGRVTVGYGHTYGVRSNDPPITAVAAEKLLDEDIDIAIADARRIVKSFDNLDGPRKTVVANMAFNLGPDRLAQFKNTIASINAGDYTDASLRMLQSKWAAQVGQRAKFLSQRMASGKW